MTPFWVSWYANKVPFTWHGPWWESGWRLSQDGSGDTATIVAAVMAASEEDAKARIVAAHDCAVEPEWRFCNQRESDWAPFCDRFPRADWMKWPYPEEPHA